MKKRHHFQARLLQSYIIFMLIMVLFSTVYWSIQLSYERHNSLKEQLVLQYRQGSSVLDAVIQRAKPVMYLHIENEIVEQVLSAEGAVSEQNASNLRYLARGLMKQNSDIVGIWYIGLHGDVYSSQVDETGHGSAFIHMTGETVPLPDGSPSPSEIGEYMSNAKSRNGLLYIGKPSYKLVGQDKEQVLPVCKELISLKSGKGIGYALIYFDFNSICDRIDDSLSDGYFTMIATQEGEELFLSNARNGIIDILHTQFPAIMEKGSSATGEKALFYQDSQSNIYGGINPLTGWYIIKACESRHMSSKYYSRITLFLGISILLFFLDIIIASSVAKRLTRNVGLLSQAFKNPGAASLSPIPCDDVSDDEIGDLILGYNDMVEKLNDSIEREYYATIRAQEMQIKMLQYQINPHFLYNCLNLISSLSIIHDAPDIANVSKMLGQMFHYSIESGGIVQIRDELNHAFNYLEIQKVRFPGNFVVDYDIDSELLNAFCMKFILQPVVENCFTHGFNGSSGRSSEMMIQLKRDGEDIIFSVLDNGSGISPERLEQIRQNLYFSGNESESAHQSIGLWNIHHRIAAYYGNPYGILIESEEGKYTCVTLKVPYQTERKDQR